MARRRVWTAWMIALVAFLTLLGSARALHNTPAPTPAPSSTDHHHDDDHHVEIAPDDVYPDPGARYRHGAPTAEWIPASYQMGEEDFDLAFQASANGIVRVDVWGYLRVYYRRVVDKETFTPYYYLFNNWNPHRNEYGVDYELYSTYTAALNRDDSDDSTPTCNDVKEAFASEPGSFPGKGFPYGCEFMEGDFGYMYKSTGSQVGFDGARALERDPESCSRVMNGTFACDTASAAKHGFSFPHGWRVYLESPQPLSERWHPPPDVQFVTLGPDAGVEGEGDLDVAGEVDQFTIRTRARVVEAGKVFALYRTAGTSGTTDPSDPFLVLKARTVDAKTVFELFVDTGVDGCEVTLVTNASWTEPESVDLAVTYDDGAAAVYVDGSLDAMGSMPAECVSPTTKPTQWRLGDAGSGMAGDVNFLTVWSRTALAPWRVRRAALADYSHVPPPDHHFNFDEPPGTTEVTNSIDNGRRSSASLDSGCEIVGVHDGRLAQLDTSLAVLDADVHVHVPWTSKLAKVFQGSFSMQMWVKPGGDVEEDVELNIFGNYDVSDPEYGDCSCACDGKPVANGTINVTDDQGAMGVTSRQCAAYGLEGCGDMVTDGVIDACPGGVDFTAVWSYNQSYTGANFDDGDGDDGMLFGDCGCFCEGNYTDDVDVTAFPGYLNGEGVPELVCSAAGPGYCQMMSAHPAFPACNVDFTTNWVPVDTYSGALYDLGDCTCTCDGANMGVLDGCDSSTKAALNQSRVGCGLYLSECGTACMTIGTCESASSVDATHALVEAYSYGGGDWGDGGGGRKLLSQNPGDTYEPQPAALQSAEIVPDRRVTGRFVKLTQHIGDSMVVAELHVFRENFGSTLSFDADLALNKKVTGTEPVGRYVRLESTVELHFREVVVFDPTDPSINLALNKPVTSSPQNPGPSGELFPESMVDGDLATYFQTYGGGWFEVDLGEEMPIGGIHIANLCDGVMSDPGWCSDGNWDATMNNRALGLKVKILDSDTNVVIETASPTQSSRAYIFAWNYRQFGEVINLDTQDDSWKGSLNHQKLVDGDHSPALLLAGTTIVDLGEETEIDGVFIVGDYDVVASKPKSLVTGSMAGFSCSVLNDGTLKCWGWNRYGQLGIGADGDATSRNTPTAVNLGAGRTAKALSLGSSHTCAILDDDTLKCWGQGIHIGAGLLGYGDTTQRNAPEATAVVNLGAGRTAKAVAAGRHHTCAILDDGTLKCWGYNNWGQLGYGDKTSRNAPEATEVVNLGPGRTAKAVAAGDSFTCAILDEGTIKCWGMHQSGAVGDGTIPTAPPWERSTPTAVDLGTGRTAKALSAGDGFACAILDDDTLKCWGVNQVSIHSEIDGTTGINAYTPTAVNLGPGRTAKAVSGGNMHQCAILDDDTLKCRGYDEHGALGLGNRPKTRNTWVAVNLGDNYGRKAKAVSCGAQHTCAMLDDDTVKCWGTGQFGTLGYGDSLEYNPGNPIQDRDAPEPTAVVPYIPHPDFTVEILDAERRSTLVTSAPMTSADGYLAEFNRAGVESIDWRYIIDSDVHSDSSYAWSDFVDQSYDWSGIKDDPGVYFKDDPGVYFGLRSPPCPENNRVENGLCTPCTNVPRGTNGGTRAAGDDPDAGDTSCAFPDRTALKAAVDSCLAVDATGVACCNHGGNCGAAGTVEMADWDVSMVTDMSSLFQSKGQFNADISRWDVSSVTTMHGMFHTADAFNQDIGTWDTSSVTTMGSMFQSTNNFNQDISMWDTSSVTDMQLMFYQASAFNQDLSRWDVSSVTTMGDMFQSSGAFNTMPVGWDTSKVTNSHNMFHSAAAWKARFTGGTDSTLPGGGWVRKENACDASVAPKHGGVGDCTDTLMSGQTCTPTCDEGYALSGETSCVDRVLTRAVCVQNVFPEDLGDCECLCCQGANCIVETQGFVPCYVTQAQCSWQGPAMCERAHNSTCNATNGTVVTEFGKHMPPPPPPVYGYGDCGCLCNDTLVGNLDVCDESGQNCGLSATACSAVGRHRCESKFNSSCTQNVTVVTEFLPDVSYTGLNASYGDCECWCNGTLTGDLNVCDNYGQNCGVDTSACDVAGASRCARRCANQNPNSLSPWPVGRYVKVLLDQHIHLRQVVVFDPTDASVNLALNKPATADSYIENYVAGNVVDGSLGTFSHTTGGNSWLEIDLEDEMPIGGIYIANLCDRVMSDPGWCSDSWNSAWNMENWQYMNNRVVEGGLKVQVLDGDKNVVTESASITESRRAYVVNFREGFTTPTDTNSWIGLDAQDNTWQQSSCVAQASDKWDSWDQSTSQFTVQTLFVPEPSFMGPAKTIYARFIRLYKSCSTMINLSELAVWHSASPSVNLAAGKSVTCYPACTLSGGGALLVDGSTDTEVVHSCYEGDSGTRGDLTEGACASSVPKSIEIDLGQDYPIDGVLIVNRLDEWRVRSEGLMVDFRDSGNSVVLTTAPITQSHMDSAGFIMDLQAGIPPFAAEFDAWRYVPEGGISNSSDFDWKNTVWCQSGETWNGQGCSANSNPSTAPVPDSGSGSGGGTSTQYGDCECYCDGSYQGKLHVEDPQGGVGVTESFCDNNGPPACPNEGFTCANPNTVNWAYDSTYTGAVFGGPSPGDSGPPPGGSTSNEYGDCECYCDGSYQGIIPVDDGVTESFCDNNGPGPSQCPNMGFTCDGGTTTVTWVYNSAYQGTNFDR